MRSRYLLFSGLIIFLFTGSILAGNLPDLVWLVIDQVSLEEIIAAETPNIDYLQKTGAFSLMNVRTADHLQPESTYLSAGAGNRCQGSKNIHTTKKVNKGVLYPQIEELRLLNQQTHYLAQPGLLGKICRENDIRIGVLGNTDTLAGKNRIIVTMVMDEAGFVPVAEVSQTILRKVDRPWGYRTDWEMMKRKLLEFREFVDILVIETGDLSRIEEYADRLSSERLTAEKLKALERIDRFVGFLLHELDLSRTQIGIIVPTPPPKAQLEGKRLSWVLFSGRGYEHGWLTSPSTRRRGIITISDLLPTLLKAVGVRGVKPVGKTAGFIREEVIWRDLQRLNDKISLINNLRPLFVKGFILIQLFILIIAIVKLLWKKLGSIIIIQKLFEYLLLALFLIPVNYLFISNLGLSSLWYLLAALVGLTTIQLNLLVNYISSRLIRVLLITLTLILLIIFDLVNSYRLLADSLLGYSSIIGARYYGLGNEYMGLFIGSVLITLTGLLELVRDKKESILKSWRWFIIPIFLMITYFIGSSSLGANFGGTITILFAGGISYLYLEKKQGKIKVFLFSFLLLILIIYLDFKAVFGPSSHIGQAVGRVIGGDWQGILRIIYRKLNMNLKLLRWTIWTRVLLAFIIYLIFLFRYPVASLKRFFEARPYLAGGFYGALAGSVVTMFVNDSGVVAAATILFYPMMSLLYFLGN